MTKFQAEVDALVAFRDALVRFRNRSADVLDAAEARVRRSLMDLDEVEGLWRREVTRRQNAAEECYRAAVAAAHQGGHVDCSSYQRALHSSEESLAHVLRVRREVESAVDHYRREGQAWSQFLDDDFGRGQQYLERCIDHFLRFGAERIPSQYLEWLAPRSAPRPPSPPSSVDRVAGTPERRKEAERPDSASEARG